MKNVFIILLITLCSCAEEEEMVKMISLEGSTFNYINSECDEANPELNQCSGFVFFQSSKVASGLLDGGDIVAEYSYNLEKKILVLTSFNDGDSEEFEIISKDKLIRKSDNTSWERSGLVLDER